MFFPFYIIEVEMKAQSAGIIYRAEDGFRYERQHGSTSNLDLLENFPVPPDVRGHRAGNWQAGKSKKVSCPVRWLEVNTSLINFTEQCCARPPAGGEMLRV